MRPSQPPAARVLVKPASPRIINRSLTTSMTFQVVDESARMMRATTSADVAMDRAALAIPAHAAVRINRWGDSASDSG